VSRGRRRFWTVASVLLGIAAIASAVAADHPAAAPGASAQKPPADSVLVQQGRRLYEQGCSDCHGFEANGIAAVAPDLHGVGALSADFYLRTGRMPLDNPDDQPVRGDSPYDQGEIAALVAYVGSLGGPPIPTVDTSGADIAKGQQLFTENCAGCHQVVGEGGMVTRASVPDLKQATPRQVAEAVRLGPYLMPPFSARQLDQDQLDSVARYVQYTKEPEDRGGWGIGHIGPIPEGMVTWLLAMVALVLTIRIIGERTTA